MSLPWFRLYHELKDDPKIGALDDSSFRVFIESLCWACEAGNDGNTGLTVTNANWAFRRNVTEPLQKLFQVGILVENQQGQIIVPKWNDRQKPSDSSAERVRKYRVKHDVTLHTPLQKRNSNAIEERRVDEKEEIICANGMDCCCAIASLFGKTENGLSRNEHDIILQLAQNPDFKEQFETIKRFKETSDPTYFPRNPFNLLNKWTQTLERAKETHKPNGHPVSQPSPDTIAALEVRKQWEASQKIK